MRNVMCIHIYTTVTVVQGDAPGRLGAYTPAEDLLLAAEVRAGRLVAKRIGRCLRVSDVELTRWALDTQIASGVPQGVPAAPGASASTRAPEVSS